MPIFKVVDYFGKNFAFIRDRKSDNLFFFLVENGQPRCLRGLFLIKVLKNEMEKL